MGVDDDVRVGELDDARPVDCHARGHLGAVVDGHFEDADVAEVRASVALEGVAGLAVAEFGGAELSGPGMADARHSEVHDLDRIGLGRV